MYFHSRYTGLHARLSHGRDSLNASRVVSVLEVPLERKAAYLDHVSYSTVVHHRLTRPSVDMPSACRPSCRYRRALDMRPLGGIVSSFRRIAASIHFSSAFALVLLFGIAGYAGPPEGYYGQADGVAGSSLRTALHEIIRPHRRVSYDSLWDHYRETDRRADGTVWDMYSDCIFSAFQSNQGGPPGTVGGYLTREHCWPKMAWGGEKNDAYSDLFHVLPGDAHTNGQKGLGPPGEVGPNHASCGLMKIGRARDGLGYEGLVFEPSDRYKGDFARIYMYFTVCYQTGPDALPCANWPLMAADGQQLARWAEVMLLRWHREDPVDSKELDRNEAIFRIQGNRNPFVDHPDWAARIWHGDAVSSQTPPRHSNAGLRANVDSAVRRSQGPDSPSVTPTEVTAHRNTPSPSEASRVPVGRSMLWLPFPILLAICTYLTWRKLRA